jgi:hypothetical protein
VPLYTSFFTRAVQAFDKSRPQTQRAYLGMEDIMTKHSVALLLTIIISISFSSSPAANIDNLSFGESGSGISHSNGKILYSALGRSLMTYVPSILPPDTRNVLYARGISLSSAPAVEDVLCDGLKPNYPNPFNPTTSIIYSVEDRSHIKLSIYDVNGRRVRTLLNGTSEPGEHTISWDGRDSQGVTVSSGIYFLCLKTNRGMFSRKMIVIK